MKRRDARPFQHDAANEGWNILELESHRQFRHKINELTRIATLPSMTTHDIQQHLHILQATYSYRLTTQLVRLLQRENAQERQAIIWLLTLLDEQQQQHAIPLLQQIAHSKQQSRAVRLSAALALAGMGATEEMNNVPRRMRLYAIS